MQVVTSTFLNGDTLNAVYRIRFQMGLIYEERLSCLIKIILMEN